MIHANVDYSSIAPFCPQIGERLMQLRHPMPFARLPHTPMQHIELQLVPVAARWELRNMDDVRQLCSNMLHALRAVHDAGFVHRDVREDNILLTSTGFVLTDWELAGTIGDAVFWQPNSEHVPPGVCNGTSWQTWMDLWQLGRVLYAQPLARKNPAGGQFVTNLLNGFFPSAEAALQGLTVW
jgi:serine/threonine protein kinase